MKRNVIVIGGVAIALTGAWVALRDRPASSAPVGDRGVALTEKGGRHARPGLSTGKGGGERVDDTAGGGTRTARLDWDAVDLVNDSKLTETDKTQIRKLQDALDANDLDDVRAAAKPLMKSNSAAVRKRVAEALGWFGTAAMPELVEMLDDADADVVETVMDVTLDAIDEMEDGPEKAELLASLAVTLTDLDDLEDVLMRFTTIDDAIVIPHLEKLIQDSANNPAKQAVLYDFLKFIKGDFL